MVRKLIRSAKEIWCPKPLEVRFKQISSTYGDMIVNAYVVWDRLTVTWIFDTGTDAEPILALIEEEAKSQNGAFSYPYPSGSYLHAETLRDLGASGIACVQLNALVDVRWHRKRFYALLLVSLSRFLFGPVEDIFDSRA